MINETNWTTFAESKRSIFQVSSTGELRKYIKKYKAFKPCTSIIVNGGRVVYVSRKAVEVPRLNC